MSLMIFRLVQLKPEKTIETGLSSVKGLFLSEGNKIVIKTNKDLNITEMKKLVESSIKNAKEDMDTRLLIESKIKASRLINEIENVKDQIETLCTKKDIENINKTSNMLKKEMKTNNKERIETLTDNLNEQTKNFAQRLIDKNFENFVGKDLDILE